MWKPPGCGGRIPLSLRSGYVGVCAIVWKSKRERDCFLFIMVHLDGFSSLSPGLMIDLGFQFFLLSVLSNA